MQVRLGSDLLAAVDAFIAKQPDPKPSRPEAIRQALAALQKLGGLD